MERSKTDIRRSLLAERQALSAAQAAAWSERIQDHLLAAAEFARARTVALYAPFRREVQTQRLFEALIRSGRTALYPRMRGRSPEMDFCPVADFSEMVPSRMGYPEPAPAAPAAELAAIDLMVLPGVGFDRQGVRLGFGAGCYDRIVGRLRADAVTVGVAYRFQVVDRLPRMDHDVPVKRLLCEEGFIPVG